MTARRWSHFLAALVTFWVAGLAAAQSDLPDGLVKITPRKMELAWLRPGADFRPYKKVIVDRTQVAFKPNWMRDYNVDAGINKVTPADAKQIMAAAQTNFDQIFMDAFRKAGFEVVTEPGPDVLRVVSGILELELNAPLGQQGFSTTWVLTAGQAVLIVEVRDSMTNALLGRVADRRETQDIGARMASTVTNLSDFRQLFGVWANICVNALTELKAVSPVPADLKPGQKL